MMTIGCFYGRRDLSENKVSGIKAIIRSFGAVIDLGANRSNSVGSVRKVSSKGLEACKDLCSVSVLIVVVASVVRIDIFIKDMSDLVNLCLI